MTVIQRTTDESTGHKYRSVISKKTPKTSEVMELHKTTFVDNLKMFRQG